jgi:transcriptional regulator with GAF, ATPase, and Fis domain
LGARPASTMLMAKLPLLSTVELRVSDLQVLFRRKIRLLVVDGPDKGNELVTAEAFITVGSAEQNNLVIADPSVSRHHLRFEAHQDGFLVTDLSSTNGTKIGDLRVKQVILEHATDLTLGSTVVRFVPTDEHVEIPLAMKESFGSVHGNSPAMRELFSQMEVAASQDVTTLISGETGTGKELIAREIHQQSRRRNGPFIIVDCGAIPATLIESELFGFMRGAFTNATSDRAGAFEEAAAGTIFLDEIGELELSMQPRLLRVLEEGQVKRLGEARHRKIDVRVIAATNRDLQLAVNQGGFRADLFYRLAVVHLHPPPLRDRLSDIPILVEAIMEDIARRHGIEPIKLDKRSMDLLQQYTWPGNVRELRNVLTRLALTSTSRGRVSLTSLIPTSPQPPPKETTGISGAFPGSDDQVGKVPFKEAKAQWLAQFEIDYLKRLLDETKGNVAEAARVSEIDRVHLYRLIKKYRLTT